MQLNGLNLDAVNHVEDFTLSNEASMVVVQTGCNKLSQANGNKKSPGQLITNSKGAVAGLEVSNSYLISR